jgi:hypothetical protein
MAGRDLTVGMSSPDCMMQASLAATLLNATAGPGFKRYNLKKLNENQDGTFYAEVSGRWIIGEKASAPPVPMKPNQQPRIHERGSMGDILYIVGLIVFFILCALYAAALERI